MAYAGSELLIMEQASVGIHPLPYAAPTREQKMDVGDQQVPGNDTVSPTDVILSERSHCLDQFSKDL